MTGLTTVTTSLSTVESEYAKHGTSLKSFPSVNMPFMENISTDDERTFIRNVMRAYIGSPCKDKIPYSFVIGYTGYLANKGENQALPPIAVTGGGAAPAEVYVEDAGVNSYDLWNNIVTGEDWFVECYFLKNGGADADKITIDKVKSTPVQNPMAPVGYFDSVQVDISSLPAEAGAINLKVNWVAKMQGGVSGGGDFIGVCTKAYWKDMSHDEQQQIIIHELGHSLKMVTNGSGILPAKPPYHYTGKGHSGNHCHCGVAAGQTSYTTEADLLSSTCVMFGAVNNTSAYCPDCAKAVKKLDMSAGF